MSRSLHKYMVPITIAGALLTMLPLSAAAAPPASSSPAPTSTTSPAATPPARTPSATPPARTPSATPVPTPSLPARPVPTPPSPTQAPKPAAPPPHNSKPTAPVSKIIVGYEPGVPAVEAPGVPTGASVIPGVDVAPGTELGDDIRTIALTEPVTIETAKELAARLAADPRIAWAEPDRMVHPLRDVVSAAPAASKMSQVDVILTSANGSVTKLNAYTFTRATSLTRSEKSSAPARAAQAPAAKTLSLPIEIEGAAPQVAQFAAFPTVTSMAPRTGSSAGGTTITIRGTRLASTISVTFGGQAATIVSRTESSVTVLTPGAPNLTVEPSEGSFTDGSLWGLDGTFGVNAPGAWNRTSGKRSVVVAVVDTGLSPHADLSRVVPGYDMITGQDLNWDGYEDDFSAANDGDGRDADPSDPGDWLSEWDVSQGIYDPSCQVSPSSWHGTHVAGIVAAASNRTGVVGVAPNVTIEPVRVLGKCGGSIIDISAGIIWASGGNVPGVPNNQNPAQVINLSLGGDGPCPIITQLAINAAVARKVTVVVAAGNTAHDAANSNPANCANVVTVGANDQAGRRAWFSDFGSTVDVSAPGVDIWSTVNSGTTSPVSDSYAKETGTSMASPFVVGVIALMLSQNPNLTPAQIEQRLKATARSFSSSTCDAANTWVTCGAGIVNAGAAVR